MIKQIFPIPDMFTPLLLSTREDGSTVYEDASPDGWAVLYALVKDERGEYVSFYVMDQTGDGELDSPTVRLVPTRYCPKCGNRMIPRIYNEKLDYNCPCCDGEPAS